MSAAARDVRAYTLVGSCPHCNAGIQSVKPSGEKSAPTFGDYVCCYQCRGFSKLSSTGLTALTDAERIEAQAIAASNAARPKVLR